METTFKAAEPSDMGELLALMRGLCEHDAMTFDEAARRDALARLIADESLGLVYVILLDGETAGYLVLGFGFSLEFHGRDAFVDELFVGEGFRGRGLGTAALGFADEVCRERGVRALHLEVDRSNTGAQALYRRSGFKDHDRYLMTRWL